MWIDPIVLSSHGSDRVTELSVLGLGAVTRLASAMAGQQATKGAMLSGPGLDWGRQSRGGWVAHLLELLLRADEMELTRRILIEDWRSASQRVPLYHTPPPSASRYLRPFRMRIGKIGTGTAGACIPPLPRG